MLQAVVPSKDKVLSPTQGYTQGMERSYDTYMDDGLYDMYVRDGLKRWGHAQDNEHKYTVMPPLDDVNMPPLDKKVSESTKDINNSESTHYYARWYY